MRQLKRERERGQKREREPGQEREIPRTNQVKREQTREIFEKFRLDYFFLQDIQSPVIDTCEIQYLNNIDIPCLIIIEIFRNSDTGFIQWRVVLTC